MIDFSHGNSSKVPAKQIDVGQDVARQIEAGDSRIFGIMAESHLKAGRQDLAPGKPLAYGVSITDGCISWEESRAMLDGLAAGVRARRAKAAASD
jgi:3-deoxy-7-phosphoheptulonate synthase